MQLKSPYCYFEFLVRQTKWPQLLQLNSRLV
jgi:hypothetical protein